MSVSRGGGLAAWPGNFLLALWPAFGGHWVELWFLNGLRRRISPARGVQTVAHLATWFVAGIVLALGMKLTAMALAGFWPVRWPGWWIGGLAFVAIELIVHVVLHLRGRPSFCNGRG